MPKKKVNVRKDYSYATKKSPPRYKRASIPRKPFYMILRGPDLDPREVIEENEVLKEIARKARFKLKFLNVKTTEEAIRALKDGNTWATGAVLTKAGLEDEDESLKRVIQKILYSVIVTSEKVTNDVALEMFQVDSKIVVD